MTWRAEVETAVIATLVHLGVSNTAANDRDAQVLDLLCDEDVTYDFIPEVQRRLRIVVPSHLWEEVSSVGEVIEMIVRLRVETSKEAEGLR